MKITLNIWSRAASRSPCHRHGGGLPGRWGLLCVVAVAWLPLAGLAGEGSRSPTGLQSVYDLQVTDLAYAPAPVDNPLKGIVANTSHSQGALDSFPHSLIFAYLPLRDTMTGPTNFNWAPLEAAIRFATNDHCQLIPRFYLDYPGKPSSAIPQYLLDGGLRTWSYTYGGNKYSLFPDYEDANLRAALASFIAAYGAAYDGDPRIAFVQIGTIGVWAEWHYGPTEMLPHWASLATQREVMSAYAAAFTKTKLQFRYPAGVNNDAGGVATFRNDDLPFGYYDDSFCRTTVGTDSSTPNWYQIPEMNLAGAMNKWKTFPNGGELGANVMTCIFSNAPCLIGEQQTWSNCVAQSHATYVHDWAAFYIVERKSGGTYYYGPNGTNAIVGAQQLGYELWVSSLLTWTNTTAVSARVTMTNTGVAPFYYKWPVQLAASTASGQILRTWSTPWDITRIIPGAGSQSYTLPLTDSPPRPFTLLMRAVNPLPVGKPLRFANVSQHATVTNWLTLGEVR